MTLETPEHQLNVVQHTHDPAARRKNPLYLPTRRILEDEFHSRELTELVERMKAVMHATGGIGISGNQIGKRLQVFLIEARPGNPRYKVLGAVPFGVYINPRILAASPTRKNFWHGCLSAVGEKRGNVATYEWIDFEAADLDGIIRQGRLDGFAAVIFQHELRHLLGGTYLDKAQTFFAKEELDKKFDRKELPFFDQADEHLPLLLDDYLIGETLEEYYRRTDRS